MTTCDFVGCNNTVTVGVENPRTSTLLLSCDRHLETIQKMVRKRFKGKISLQQKLETYEF
jgi:hypothetical protein